MPSSVTWDRVSTDTRCSQRRVSLLRIMMPDTPKGVNKGVRRLNCQPKKTAKQPKYTTKKGFFATSAHSSAG